MRRKIVLNCAQQFYLQKETIVFAEYLGLVQCTIAVLHLQRKCTENKNNKRYRVSK